MSKEPSPRCTVPGCAKIRTYRNTIHPYCEMHKGRQRRNNRFGLRDKSFHKLEKLPHSADAFIRENAGQMFDREMAEKLRTQGYLGATVWTVKYRRRKLGIRKYASGEEKKHKAWIRQQALRRYGHRCELCGYPLFVETHHILPKHQGGPHEIVNLMVVCSNCHILLTRNHVKLAARPEIPRLQIRIRKILRSAYLNLG